MKNVFYKLFLNRSPRIVFRMSNSLASAFPNLLAAWRRRDDARRNDSFTELGQARIALDNARTGFHAHRYGIR